MKYYYAIFASERGSKDLIRVVETLDSARYYSAQFHRNNPNKNFKVWISDDWGMFTTWKKPAIINGELTKKGAH